MQKVLVTGAAGFIGSHVVDRLIKDGEKVVALDNLSTGVRENVAAGIPFELVDICDSQALDEVFKRHQIGSVIHLASHINTNIHGEDTRQDVSINILGTINLVEACLKYKVENLVYGSSVAVYGRPNSEDMPIAEAGPIRPIYSYGLAKQTTENYLDYYATNRGLNYKALRYVNVYGPRQPIYGEVGVIAIFSNRIVRGLPLAIYGDGEQVRDFLYVDDAVDATIAAWRHPDSLVVNVGSGVASTVNDVFAAFSAAEGGSLTFERQPLRSGEIGRFSCDVSLANSRLNWQAKIDLRSGIARTLEFEKRVAYARQLK